MIASKDEILTFLNTLKPELTANGIISLGLFGSIVKDVRRTAKMSR